MSKAIAATTVVLAACTAGVIALAGGSSATDGVTDQSQAQQTAARDQYSALQNAPVSGTVTNDGWSERFRKATAARGEHVAKGDIRTAVSTPTVTVDVALTDRQLCLHVADSGGGGSVGCSLISQTGTEAKPQISVDRTRNGMRITMLAPDGVSAVTVRGPGARAIDIPIAHNVATTRTNEPSVTLSWLDQNGQAHRQTIPRP